MAEADEPDEASSASSEEQRERGAIRLGIGGALAGVGAALIGFGIVEFRRAQTHLELCQGREQSPTLVLSDPCSFDPPTLGFTSAGLSWGLSIPVVVGAGLLLARGVKLVRASRAGPSPQASVYPWWTGDGGGLGLVVRF